ncbi:hypothetical protein B1987_15040 [Mycobacterium kansasii]|nr:hypothetical protein B1987_15040 [Mycobacterium kansasii]
MFESYYKPAIFPHRYTRRPIEGYTAEGAIIDLRDGVPRPVSKNWATTVVADDPAAAYEPS